MRQIICEYDNITVGKLLLELMRYMQAKGMVTDENSANFKKCVEIGNRLIGKKISAKASGQTQTTKPIISVVDYEKYLNNLFEIYGLEPRSSFRITGEQIDGSFLLHNEVYLLEAKWTNKKVDKGDLVIFNEKVSSKSGFTRGLFISFSDFSDEALATFAKGANRKYCFDDSTRISGFFKP